MRVLAIRARDPAQRLAFDASHRLLAFDAELLLKLGRQDDRTWKAVLLAGGLSTAYRNGCLCTVTNLTSPCDGLCLATPSGSSGPFPFPQPQRSLNAVVGVFHV